MTILSLLQKKVIGDNESKEHHTTKRRYNKSNNNNGLFLISFLVMSIISLFPYSATSSPLSFRMPSITYRCSRTASPSAAFLYYTRGTSKRKDCPPNRLPTRIHLASLSTKSSTSSSTEQQKEIRYVNKSSSHENAYYNGTTLTAANSIHTATKINIHPSAGNDQREQTTKEQPYKHLFTLSLPDGTCVGLRLSQKWNNQKKTDDGDDDDDDDLSPESIANNNKHWIKSILHPKEISYPAENLKLSKITRNTFFIGRIAMRHALYTISHPTSSKHVKLPVVSKEDPCILKDVHGRPNMPDGYLGSISHKKVTGVALVSHDHDHDSVPNKNKKKCLTKGVGVDIEQTSSRHKSIARRILTKREISNLGRIEGVTKEEEVFLRFSLKESVYKAMHPLINQYVGFQEAEITPLPDGTANVWLNLTNKAHERFESVTAHWRRLELGDSGDGDEDFFLTSASVLLKTPLEVGGEEEEDDCK